MLVNKNDIKVKGSAKGGIDKQSAADLSCSILEKPLELKNWGKRMRKMVKGKAKN